MDSDWLSMSVSFIGWNKNRSESYSSDIVSLCLYRYSRGVKGPSHWSVYNWGLIVLFCVLCEQVKPLIWIESVIEKHSHSRIEYMIKVRTPPSV